MPVYKVDDLTDTKTEVNGKWVIARPLNYQYRTIAGRIKDAWAVFIGKADAVEYEEGGEVR